MNRFQSTEQVAGSQRTEPWYAHPADAVLAAMDSSRQGLSQGEARQRLERYGPNRLEPPAQQTALKRFLRQFHNVLIYVLIAAALLTAWLGEYIDSGIIAAVVLINALIGYFQEGKAEKALDAIRQMLSSQATVIRDGQRHTVSAEEVVPGDVVFVESGDKVPADLRLLQVKDLRVDEAVLTGESVPVDKQTDPVEADAAVGDRLNLAFSGTFVRAGQGYGVVTATGEATEIGKVSGMLAQVETLTTPLLKQIGTFGRVLSAVILVLAAGTFAFGVGVWGYEVPTMFMAAVGLAVAAIPEGLPAILTIVLAIGVQRMADRHAIIRRLPAVDTLGSVTVICTDKTGTLTVVRVPAYSPYAVAEHSVGMMLTLNRKFHRAYQRVREGNFALEGLLGFDLHGQTVGIVGTGKIGSKVARILHGFGCELLGHDVVENQECRDWGLRYTNLEELLEASSIVTLHCPLTPATHHLIDRDAIARMRPGVMLINTSRGALVDTRAVIDGLKSGRIGYVGLDVYEEEGDLFFEDLSGRVIQDDVFARLNTFPNVLITGHQAFFTEQAMRNIAQTTLENLTHVSRGEAGKAHTVPYEPTGPR